MNLILKKQLPQTRRSCAAWAPSSALPLLDAMVPALCWPPAQAPTRLAILYFPNGVADGHLDPVKTDGDIAALPEELPRTLEPLAQVSQRHLRAGRSDRRWRPRAWRWPGRSRPRGRELSDRRASEEDLRQGSAGRRLDGPVRGAEDRQRRRGSPRSNSAAKRAFRAATATTAIAALTATASRGARHRRRIRRKSGRARSSSGCSAAARSSAIPAVRAKHERYQKSVLDSVLEDARRLQGRARTHRPPQAGRVPLRGPRHRNPHPENRTRQRADDPESR